MAVHSGFEDPSLIDGEQKILLVERGGRVYLAGQSERKGLAVPGALPCGEVSGL